MTGKYRLFKDDEHDLLVQAVMLDHNLTCGYISSRTDCPVGERQVGKYRDGSAAVPLCFWTLLYRLTRDHRILQLITGGMNVIVVDLPDACDNAPEATIKHLVETAKTNAEVVATLGKIWQDGEVNRKDFQEVAELDRATAEAIKATARTNHAIQTAFKKTKY